MIFWGVLALSIFGWVTALLEPVYTVLNSILNLASLANDGPLPGYHTDSFSTFLKVYENVTTSMRIFEVFTIAGWVMYIIGLLQFKNAQVSQRGLRLSASLNTACWLGLAGIFCGFLAGFLGLFGLLFRLISWVLMLISLFKFRNTFSRLSWEKSWNHKAQNGASKLKTSYTFAIILEFFPLICSVVIFFVAFGAINSSSSIAREFINNGMGAVASYLAGGIVFIIILLLAGFALWICKIIWLFDGWNKVKNGCIRKDILAGQQPEAETLLNEEEEDEDGNEDLIVVAVPESEISAEESDIEEEDATDNKRNLIIGGSIAGGAILIALILWLCSGGKSDNKEQESEQTYPTEIEFSDNAEETEYSSPSNIAEPEPDPRVVNEEIQSNESSISNSGAPIYKGSINGKYAIEMTLTSDGSSVTGEYWYTKNKIPIQLRGEFTDGYEHLVLEEYNGMTMTGKFEGTLANEMYDGTWTSSDGKRSYPFTVVRRYRH